MNSDTVDFKNGVACPIYPDVVLIGRYWNRRFNVQKGSEVSGDEHSCMGFNSQAIDRVHGNQAFSEFLRTRPFLHARSLEEQIGWFVLTGVPQQTDWFRDRNVVRVLRFHLLPSMVQSGTVRIASVGCSFGMEVYSYLLSLWEFRNQIELHGFDINTDTLQVAVRGIYPGRQPHANSLLDCLPVSFQDEAVVTRSVISDVVGGVSIVNRTSGPEVWFQFSELARRQVHFSFHDILDAPLSGRFQIISLLKVLLHYPRESRLAILRNVHASLVEGGWLLGDSDYAYDDHVYEIGAHGAHEIGIREEFRESGFIRMPAYVPGWWGGPEDLTHKVMLWRRR